MNKPSKEKTEEALVEEFLVRMQRDKNMKVMLRALKKEYKEQGFHFRYDNTSRMQAQNQTQAFERVKSVQSDLFTWIEDRLWLGQFVPALKGMIYLVESFPTPTKRFQHFYKIFMNFVSLKMEEEKKAADKS